MVLALATAGLDRNLSAAALRDFCHIDLTSLTDKTNRRDRQQNQDPETH
jgi:hypothetical protein